MIEEITTIIIMYTMLYGTNQMWCRLRLVNHMFKRIVDEKFRLVDGNRYKLTALISNLNNVEHENEDPMLEDKNAGFMFSFAYKGKKGNKVIRRYKIRVDHTEKESPKNWVILEKFSSKKFTFEPYYTMNKMFILQLPWLFQFLEHVVHCKTSNLVRPDDLCYDSSGEITQECMFCTLVMSKFVNFDLNIQSYSHLFFCSGEHFYKVMKPNREKFKNIANKALAEDPSILNLCCSLHGIKLSEEEKRETVQTVINSMDDPNSKFYSGLRRLTTLMEDPMNIWDIVTGCDEVTRKIRVYIGREIREQLSDDREWDVVRFFTFEFKERLERIYKSFIWEHFSKEDKENPFSDAFNRTYYLATNIVSGLFMRPKSWNDKVSLPYYKMLEQMAFNTLESLLKLFGVGAKHLERWIDEHNSLCCFAPTSRLTYKLLESEFAFGRFLFHHGSPEKENYKLKIPSKKYMILKNALLSSTPDDRETLDNFEKIFFGGYYS
jgi:hypothetical protein